jgi:pimeloyl-ACP methyl ester carboxylesterase
MAPELRQRELTALGLRTRVFERGPAEAEEAVVLLHGHPGSAEDWHSLMGRLPDSARSVAFDLPGFGKAEKPKEWDYSAGTYATYFAAAFWELGIKRAHLVMHDLGGVGVMWGAAYPESFASAVLIDTGILLDFRWHPVARLYRTWPLAEAMTALTNRAGFRAVMKLYNPQPRKLPPEIVDRWWQDYELRTRRAALGFYRAAPPEVMQRLVEPLRRLDRPALVVWGAHDPAVPVEQAERQRQSFPSAEVVVFEDSGHWPYLDDPERAAEVIVPFLERHLSLEGAAARR